MSVSVERRWERLQTLPFRVFNDKLPVDELGLQNYEVSMYF